MIYVNVVLTVKSEQDVAEVGRLLTAHGRLSRAEPGCARFELYHSKADKMVYILNEHWESQAALDQHRLAEGYTTIYVPQVLPKIDRIGHPCELLE